MGYQKRGHIHKPCGCPRPKWVRCSHPWHFAFRYVGKEYRFSLNKQTGKPSGYVMTKTEAEQLADQFRHEIRSGVFQPAPRPAAPVPAVDLTRLTFGDVADQYLREYVPFDHLNGGARREGSRKIMAMYVGLLKKAQVPGAGGESVALSAKALADITRADVEAVRHGWKLQTTAAKGGRIGVERALKRLRHLFNWAIEVGHIERTPFKIADKVVIHLSRETSRKRRLEPGEEDKLVTNAEPWLQALIITALETGCRVGELLGLRWRDVKWAQNILLLPADLTKTSEDRDVPLTTRVKGVLEMRRQGPDGQEFPGSAFVFGNAVGERVASVRRPWDKLCAAVGIEGLHFHDLRREFACRLRESGAPDHIVAAWLGHANISTTSTYLKTNRVGLQAYLKKLEQHQRICKEFVNQPPTEAAEGSDPDAANDAKLLN